MRYLAHALAALLQDLLPTILFAGLVALHVGPVAATLAAGALSISQICILALMRRPIAPLQWASLGLVIIFGAATVLAHDVRFLMAKPTLIYAIVGVVMLKRGWMLRYLPRAAGGRGAGMMIRFGYVWAGLMLVTAAANLVVAIRFPEQWPQFLATFPLVSKLALFGVQYLFVRHAARKEAVRDAEPAPAAA